MGNLLRCQRARMGSLHRGTSFHMRIVSNVYYTPTNINLLYDFPTCWIFQFVLHVVDWAWEIAACGRFEQVLVFPRPSIHRVSQSFSWQWILCMVNEVMLCFVSAILLTYGFLSMYSIPIFLFIQHNFPYLWRPPQYMSLAVASADKAVQSEVPMPLRCLRLSKLSGNDCISRRTNL